MMRRIALSTAVILAIVIGALALWQMRDAAQLLLISLAAAAGLGPAVSWLTVRGLRLPLAIAVTYIAVLGALAGALALLGSLLSVELGTVLDNLPTWYEQLRLALLAGGSWATTLGSFFPPFSTITAGLVEAEPGDLSGWVVGVLTQLTIVAVLIVSAATLGFYWLLGRQRIERLWLSLMPLAARTRARLVWEQVYNEVGVYVRGEAAIVVVTTLSLLSVYTLLGVPGAATLATIGGLAQVVPLLGVPIAVIPGAVLALTQGPTTAALALAGALYAVAVTRQVIGPIVLRGGTAVNPVLVIVLIMALAELGGLWLILLGPPLAAALQASARALIDEQIAATQPATIELDALRERLDAIEAGVGEDAAGSARLADMLERARRLLSDADTLLPSPDEDRPAPGAPVRS